jgi:pimeloyl-ACP methyl ester carboxylesterase
MLLHGIFCDRSWWTQPGYTDELRGDHHIANVDVRGHGESGKPHESAAYSYDLLIADVLAVADAEGMDRFAMWGHSYGGDIAWMTAAAVPDRVQAVITTGAWDPRVDPEYSIENSQWFKAVRDGGTRGLLERFELEDGDAFDREFPEWARAVTLRGDAEAFIAAFEGQFDWISVDELRSFPVPVLLIAGELDDPDDDAAKIATMIPKGQNLRLPGLGHGGSCLAAKLTIPTARAFLDRWFA